MAERYYLWGAGGVGRRAVSYLAPLGVVEGVIDGDPAKHGRMLSGFVIAGYESAKPRLKKSGVIIAHFDPGTTEAVLDADGVSHHRLSDFIPMWFWRERRLNAVGFLDFPITTRCTLNCADCMQYIPCRGKRDVPLETLKGDLDALFDGIAFVGEVSVIGGEPFLHRQLPHLLAYIGERYRDRVGSLVITTNGSVVPEAHTLRLCAELGVFISISDYSGAVSGLCGSIARLEAEAAAAGAAAGRKRWSWVSPGKFDSASDFEGCAMAHMQLRDSKLWRCTLMAAGEAASFCEAKSGSDYLSLPQCGEDELHGFLSAGALTAKTTQCENCLYPKGIAIPSAVQKL